MPGLGATDLSPCNAARRALADDVRELRTKCVMLDNSVQELKAAYASNKQLRSKVVDLETQLRSLDDTILGLLEFKTHAIKLLQALVLKHDVDEIKGQILSLALQSKDPNVFLKSIVDGEQGSDEMEGNAAIMELGSSHQPTAMDAESLQCELCDSRLLKDACNNVLLHLFGAVRILKQEQTLYLHGLTRNDPRWPGAGVGDQRCTFIRFDFTKSCDDPINIDAFKEYCKFVRNHGVQRVPVAEEVIRKATNATIQERYQIKYKYEAEKHRHYLKS
ncbi:hypothetical protein FRC11_011329 [Ceratobasidium sp. 423]|nr:hypothetical protein FRC11_011329 [Ceratobasidium sp. 423]